MSVCLFVCLLICLSVCLSIRLFVCPFVCLFVCPSVYQSVCLSVHLSVSLSVCLYILSEMFLNFYNIKLFILCMTFQSGAWPLGQANASPFTIPQELSRSISTVWGYYGCGYYVLLCYVVLYSLSRFTTQSLMVGSWCGCIIYAMVI